MKISYKWLQDYLQIDISVKEVADLLTDIGLEVEGIEEIDSIKGGLKGVVVGKIITKEKHPNADRLNLTSVDIGGDELIQIVCGATNVDIGQKVPVATVGTWLYDGEEKFKIKKGKIRGEESFGMICAEYELGLGDDNEGIMVLEDNAKVGINASEYFNLESDFIFNIALTPNRSDAMSHIGVARDLMAIFNHKGMQVQMCIPSVTNFNIVSNKNKISVDVQNPDLCPRYTGLSISDVRIEESPRWLKNRLRSIGVSPVNNVVDITNYVLHETGQPLHAFDYNKITGEKVIVSTIEDQTKFTTLDQVERKLSKEDLMICSAESPLCIAGVFGGLESGVTNSTKDIFLESACFNPVSVRKTAKRHGLSTDASFRFERGSDPNITVYALKRAAIMINDICGGVVSSDIIDVYPKIISHFEVKLNYNNMDKLIGEYIDRDVVKSILKDLGIEIKKEMKDGLSLFIPPFKTDVTREVDVIEEVLRIYGFNTVKTTKNIQSSFINPSKLDSLYFVNIISDLLSNTGFNEIMNNSLTKSSYTKLIGDLKESEDVSIINPLSNDLNIMRQSLFFGGLESIVYNQNRKNVNLKLYEFGKTYHRNNKKYIERQRLHLFITGAEREENWNTDSRKVDFYSIKEKVHHILSKLNIENISSKSIISYGFSEGLMYLCKGERLVCFGKVEEDICKSFDIKEDVYAADFNWDLLMKLVSNSTEIVYKDINKFPEVRRDLSLLIDVNVSFDNIIDVAKSKKYSVIKSINLFDVYQGKELPQGKKSYAISFVLADNNKTLTDIYVDKVMNDLIDAFKKDLTAEIR